MAFFRVQPLPNGIGQSPVSDYVKVGGLDAVEAAERILQIPLQREPRHNMYIRAFVHRFNGPLGTPLALYAAEST